MNLQSSDLPRISSHDLVAAACEWWCEAGVELFVADEPVDWLRIDEPVAETARHIQTAPAPAPSAIERVIAPPLDFAASSVDLPETLEEFQVWWRSDPSLSTAPPPRRTGPRGRAGADLFVILAQPCDDDGGEVLTGAMRSMAERIVRSAGYDPDRVYWASALPARDDAVDWQELSKRGWADIIARHVGLVAAPRVMAFGREMGPLFGCDSENVRQPCQIACGGRPVPVLVAPDLALVARNAAQRRAFWQRWMTSTA